MCYVFHFFSCSKVLLQFLSAQNKYNLLLYVMSFYESEFVIRGKGWRIERTDRRQPKSRDFEITH